MAGIAKSPDEKSAPLSQTTVVFEQIRSDILHGALEPGSKLKIELLLERYGTGATPVREALSILSTTGLVERVENRGFRVAVVSPEHYAEILWTRCFVEERAVREAVLHGDVAWEEKIVLAQFHLQREAARLDKKDDGSLRQWEAAHFEFHAALISACPSKPLLRFCEQLYNESNRYRYIARLARGPRTGAVEEHKRVADAALDRNGDLAGSLLVEHYRRTGELLKAKLTGFDPKAGMRPALKVTEQG
ncbi:GntR family transcriptional regulator [Rhizobium sullae]|uniref:GntR family transcriptional regulator n=1 Tax=Rhizobium sullae TaxID=50338 RepID=UPI000B35DDF9|nr:GntR family transcriptional regulator [Rhizobium sullae]